jgi:hypothetical protein
MGNLMIITKCCAEPKNENESEDININIKKQPPIEKHESFDTIIPYDS